MRGIFQLYEILGGRNASKRDSHRRGGALSKRGLQPRGILLWIKGHFALIFLLSFQTMPGAATSTLDRRFSHFGPTSGAFLSQTNKLISYCPQFACLTTPSADHQVATALFSSTTAFDGSAEEQTVGIETYIRSGFTPAWAPSHTYAKGANVSANGQVYRAISGGTSDHGTGPKGTGSLIHDNSVIWTWINSSAINSKVGLYNETGTYPGGGASWGQANNVQLQPDAIPSFNVNTELDFTNNAAECIIGVANCNNLYVATSGPFRSTSAVAILTGNRDDGPAAAVHWGVRLTGAKLASDADIEDDAGADVAFGIGITSFVRTHHKVGIAFGGDYAEAQIMGRGWSVGPDGAIVASRMVGKLRTPPSSRAPCTPGEFADDEAFHYVCVAQDHWKRVRLTEF